MSSTTPGGRRSTRSSTAIERPYESAKRRVTAGRRAEIAAIRSVLAELDGAAPPGMPEAGSTLHLGGVPMIADDMITFVRNDLVVFGIGVAVFLVIVLGLIFRAARWVALRSPAASTPAC